MAISANTWQSFVVTLIVDLSSPSTQCAYSELVTLPSQNCSTSFKLPKLNFLDKNRVHLEENLTAPGARTCSWMALKVWQLQRQRRRAQSLEFWLYFAPETHISEVRMCVLSSLRISVFHWLSAGADAGAVLHWFLFNTSLQLETFLCYRKQKTAFCWKVTGTGSGRKSYWW